MKKNKIPRAPAHLSKEAKRLWKQLLSEWKVDDAGSLAILRTGMESFDRSQEARRTLAKDGLTITDRWDQTKAHPVAAVLRDAEASFRAAMRQIGVDKNIDAPAPRGVGRPGGGY